MTTKKDCSLSNDKLQPFSNDSSHIDNNNKYSDLNLNQSYKSPISVQSCSKSNNNKNNDSTTVSDKHEEKGKSELRNKSSDFYLNSLNHNVEDKEERAKKPKDGTSDAKNSTLSLHIAAFENSVEATKFDSIDGKNGESKRKKSDLNKLLFSGINSIIENPFEFPRQQKRNRFCKPEVMGFRASQRLINPYPLPSLFNAQFSNAFARNFPIRIPYLNVQPNLARVQGYQQQLSYHQLSTRFNSSLGDWRSHNMWNDETWKPWPQHDLQYRPIHPVHRLAPAPPYAPSSASHPPPLSSSFHPYGRPERVAPYAKPLYFNETNPPAPYHRNPSNRPDYWTPRALPPIVPLKTPHMELWKDFGAPSKPLEVILYARKSAKECSVRWQKPELAPQYAQSHVIKIFENEKLLDTAEIDRNTNEYSFKTQPGLFYTCEFRVKDAREINTAEGTIRFRATFSMDEMGKLLEKALDYVCVSRPQMHPFRILYRCKPQCYWDDIQVRSENIMRKYIKDDNGQAANPTNGMIFGLFFSARLLPNGTLPPSSPFGNIRMSLPAEVLLDPERVNMYFSDFYCNRLTHYVTIVICIKGSRTDAFCMDKLVQVAPNNPFVKVMYGPRGYEFYVNKAVWVEIYYTENVPLIWGKFDRVTATGLGTSRLGGLPHNKTCTVCNLYPIGKKGTTSVDEVLYEEDQNEIVAQQHLEKMIASMRNSELSTQECEDIVFLVSDMVDQIAYDNDVSFTVKKDGSIFGNESLPIETALNMVNEEGVDEHPTTKAIASKIRCLHEDVTKRLDRVQSIIVKRKNSIKKIFRK